MLQDAIDGGGGEILVLGKGLPCYIPPTAVRIERRAMKNILPVLFLLASLLTAQADGTTRSAQEELRRRNFYFGDITGSESAELSTAVQRYQKRKGFASTGELDRQTLRSLGLLPRQPGEAPPPELKWPDEPVLRSDAAVDVAAEAVQIAEETGVAPESIAPEAVKKMRQTGQRASRSSAPSHSASPQSRETATTEVRSQRMEPKELAKFVQRYLDAASRNDLRHELAFYGDRIDYYSAGNIDRRIAERAIRKHHLRWPKRRHRVVSLISYRHDLRRGEIHLVFRARFTLKNQQHRVEGETDNHMVINAATVDPRIISIAEDRVRG